MQDAPLIVRMDKRIPITAQDVVNTKSKQELKQIIRNMVKNLGRSIVDFICESRKQAKIETTGQLVDIIK